MRIVAGDLSVNADPREHAITVNADPSPSRDRHS